MTYNEIFQNRAILNNVPLVYEGRKLPKTTAASVMILRVKYQQRVDEFVKLIQEVLKGLKKEGYDERLQAVQTMEDVDRRKKAAEEWNGEGEKPAMPTDEELAKAEETRATLDAFNEEKKELEEAYQEAQTREGAKDVPFKDSKLSKEELADIYEMIGADGEFDYTVPGQDKPFKVAKEWFLNMVAMNLV